MRITSFTFAAMQAALPSAALAQAAPYKLVITMNGSIAVVDYPSRARCEAARDAVEAEVARRTEIMLRSLPPGSTVTPGTGGSFCIPG